MAVITSFGHMGGSRGVLVGYEFNGTKYEQVPSREFAGAEETELLYEKLDKAPRLSVQ
jgi:hypothetical protein